MIVLGVTGPSGSGKSLVSRAFRTMGSPVLDADAVYHSLIDRETPCTRALAEVFGNEILSDSGGVDRRRLSAIVFCGGEREKERLALLNKITHPFVLEGCYLWLEEQRCAGADAVVLDAPLLIESGLHQKCDHVIAVLAPQALRTSRIMERDGLTTAEAESRIAAQKDDEFYRNQADFLFVNDGDSAEAEGFVASLLSQLSISPKNKF